MGQKFVVAIATAVIAVTHGIAGYSGARVASLKYEAKIAKAEAEAQERIAKQEEESYEVYAKQQEALSKAIAARDKALRSVASLRATASGVRNLAEQRAKADESGDSGNDSAKRIGECERLLGEGAELVSEGAELSIRIASDKNTVTSVLVGK